jgi:hypothetical protein
VGISLGNLWETFPAKISRGLSRGLEGLGTTSEKQDLRHKFNDGCKDLCVKTGADTQPQICRISIARRLDQCQIEPEGPIYSSRT